MYRIVDIADPEGAVEIAAYDSAYTALERMRREVLSGEAALMSGWRLLDPSDTVLAEPADFFDGG